MDPSRNRYYPPASQFVLCGCIHKEKAVARRPYDGYGAPLTKEAGLQAYKVIGRLAGKLLKARERAA